MPTLPPSATPSAAPIGARPAGPAAPGAQVVLRAGAEVVARVVEAPANGGRGMIALAGALLAARLPAGLAVGQTLALTVAGLERGEIMLRLRAAGSDGGGAEGASRARVAGALAASGDGDLVRIAAALQPPGGGVELPGGELVAIHLPAPNDARPFVVEGEPDDGGRPEGDDAGEAGFVLHSAALGPIEVRLRLAGGALSATVVVDPATIGATRAALPELAAGLARAVGAEVAVGVQERGAGAARPAPPRTDEAFDAYA